MAHLSIISTTPCFIWARDVSRKALPQQWIREFTWMAVTATAAPVKDCYRFETVTAYRYAAAIATQLLLLPLLMPYSYCYHC